MQQPVRYYITKRGDEPTVRSVKVALGDSVADERGEGGELAPGAVSSAPKDDAQATRVVSRLVKGAISKTRQGAK